MSGYTQIINALNEIRVFLHTKLNAQFMNSLQGAAEAIQKILADPNLPKNINEVLTQLQELLKNANQEDLVGKISGMLKQAQELLKLVDPETIKALTNLIKEAEKADLVKNIINALGSVNKILIN